SRLARLQMDPTLQMAWEQDGIFIFRNDPAAPVANQGTWEWSPYLRLTGYDLAQSDAQGAFDPASPIHTETGGKLRVSLYWTALAAMPADYTISVTLAAPDGWIVAQADSWPGNGGLATSAWKAGRSIRDIHYLDLPPGRGKEELRLVIVVYDLNTLER